jgi:hypothetical protein
MPNWVYNRLTITHPNIDKVNALENYIKDETNQSLFNFLRPQPENVVDDNDEEREWRTNNWGTTWEDSEMDNMIRTNNTLEFTFKTAWCNAVYFFNFLADEKWEFRNIYEEEGPQFFGIHTHTNGNNWVDMPNGKRAIIRLKEQLKEEDREFYNEFEETLDNLIESLEDDENEDEDEEDEEDEDDENKPVTEASRIMLKETIHWKYGSDQFFGKDKEYIKNWWKNNLEVNSDKYDEPWFALIATPNIAKTINWDWICKELDWIHEHNSKSESEED